MGVYDTTAGTAAIEVVNTEQAAAWDGHEGDVWTEQADRYDRASRRHWQRFVDAQRIGVADHVLDVGCGTGGATRALARIASGGSVIGIDLSTRMLELARTRSVEQGLDNVSFVRGDAQVFAFEPESFDVAMSSFGAMFFNDPVAAFTNIAGGLRRDGLLALMAWRTLEENEWLMSLRQALALGRELPVPPPDAPTPFALASPERVRRILDTAGFVGIELEPIDEPVDLGADADDALEFAKSMGIVEGLMHALDEHDRTTAMSNLAELFHEHATPDGVLFDSAAWLITARRS